MHILARVARLLNKMLKMFDNQSLLDITILTLLVLIHNKIAKFLDKMHKLLKTLFDKIVSTMKQVFKHYLKKQVLKYFQIKWKMNKMKRRMKRNLHLPHLPYPLFKGNMTW